MHNILRICAPLSRSSAGLCATGLVNFSVEPASMGIQNGSSREIGNVKQTETSPLLPGGNVLSPPLSSSWKTFCNLFITIVGAGVLDLPYAFKQTGWLEELLILAGVSAAMYYSMMLLVRCRRQMERDSNLGSIDTYSELGLHTLGKVGQISVDALILLSQGGFCIAYLIFIGENLASVFSRQDALASTFQPSSTSEFPVFSHGGTSGNFTLLQTSWGWRTKDIYIWIVFPVQVAMACIHSLTRLAPFSMFADIVNVTAMIVVMTTEFSSIVTNHGEQVQAFTGTTSFLFGLGVAIYAIEGICLVLPLESVIKDRSKFGGVLAAAMFSITLLYTVFGLLGYLAYGEYTKDIVTLNLGNSLQTVIVKLGLCTGLLFTYPIMMHPVYEVIERRVLQGRASQLLRTLLVLATAWVAVTVPHFGSFLSLVGSSVCCLLSFVLPGAIHLHVFRQSHSWFTKGIDYLLIIGGIVFGILGTWSSIRDIAW